MELTTTSLSNNRELTKQTPEEVLAEIEKTEDWLRNRPNADWQTRFDMISRLAELNNHLDKYQDEHHKTKIQR